MPEGLSAGQVGWVTCGMKDARDACLGDTFHHTGSPAVALENFVPQKAMVYAGLFPFDSTQFIKLDEAVRRVRRLHIQLRCPSLIFVAADTHRSVSDSESGEFCSSWSGLSFRLLGRFACGGLPTATGRRIPVRSACHQVLRKPEALVDAARPCANGANKARYSRRSARQGDLYR